MQNTSFPCESLKYFSDLFSADKPNVTDLIASCPQQCALAWGTGNPDLSGIGVFISYSLQLAVSIVLGPGYMLLQPLFLSHSGFRQYLSSIHVVALTTTFLFASPIAIASIIHLRGQPALFEIIFLYHLNVMEFLCGLVLLISFWVGRTDEGARYEAIGYREKTTMVLGGLLHSGLFGGVMHWSGLASRGKDSVLEFVLACNAAGTTVPMPLVQNLPLSSDTDLAFSSNRRLNDFIIFLIFAGCLIGCYVCILALPRLCRALRAILPQTVENLDKRFGNFNSVCKLLATGLAAGMVYCFVKMYLERQQLARVASDEFTDNKWAFGQVVALFVWIPLVTEMLFPLILAATVDVQNLFDGLKKWTNDEVTVSHERGRV